MLTIWITTTGKLQIYIYSAMEGVLHEYTCGPFDANFSSKGITNSFGLTSTIIACLFGVLPWIMVQILFLWLILDQHREITEVKI